MKRLIILFNLCVFSVFLVAQTGWMWQNPLPQGNRLDAVSMSGTHWAVGAGGTIIHHIMPGDYWEIVNIGTVENLSDVYMNSIDGHGWIVGDNGTVFFTENKGEIWTQQNSGVTENLYSVSAVTLACVWACGDNGTVIKSTYDGETEWDNVSPPHNLKFNAINAYHCNEAWVVGEDGVLIYTTDGGHIWTNGYAGTSWDLTDMDMSESGTSYLCGYSGIILSKEWDATSWVKENELLSYRLYSITKPLGAPGYAVGEYGTILKGTNGSWEEMESEVPWSLWDIDKISLQDYTYQIVGDYGIMLRNDGWDSEFSIVNDVCWNFVQSICFVNKDTGWAVTSDYDWDTRKDGTILHTTDGGATWTIQKEVESSLNDVFFINENEGWAVGRNGTILHTTTGGKYWATQTSSISGLITSVRFVDENNGWIVSRDNWGEVAHTTNGGNTWTKQTNPSNNPLHDVFFIDENNGWAVGLDSSVIRTTNGGETWRWYNVNASRGYRFASVFFVDDMHGWMAGIYGSIMRTADGGETWQEIESGVDESFNDIFFIDTLKGWAVGDQGMILHSTDGGLTWQKQVSGVASNFLGSVFFIDENKGWVGGQGGTIIYTLHGGQSQTNTIYVDIENNSGTENGSLEYPYNTVAEALDMAIAGDTIIIRPGEYEETVFTELTMGDGITIIGTDSSSTIIKIPLYFGELPRNFFTEISGLTCPGYVFPGAEGHAKINISECHFGSMEINSENGYEYIVENCTVDGFINNKSGTNALYIRNNLFLDGGIADEGSTLDGWDFHVFEGNTMNRISGTDPLEAVIRVNSGSAIIKNNAVNVYGLGTAIYLNSVASATVLDNAITMFASIDLKNSCLQNIETSLENTTGIYNQTSGGTISGNIITGSDYGYYSNKGISFFESNVIENVNIGFYSNGNETVQNNIIFNNDSVGIVLECSVDLGGGAKNSAGRNTLRNNSYCDLLIKYQSEIPDTVFACYNYWDHDVESDILLHDVHIEHTENLIVKVSGFLQVPSVPQLLLPEDHSSDISKNVILDWGITSIPDYYHVQIAFDNIFSQLVIDTADLVDSEFTCFLLPETDYYWRVRAENPAGNSSWSEVRMFTTAVSDRMEIASAYEEVLLFPNPASDWFLVHIDKKCSFVKQIDIFNLTGKCELTRIFGTTENVIRMDVENLRSGIYICRIVLQDKIVTQRFAIQRD